MKMYSHNQIQLTIKQTFHWKLLCSQTTTKWLPNLPRCLTHGVPESGFQDIVNWYTEATKLNVSFANHNKTRRATIDALKNTIPKHICHNMSPHTVSVALVGIDEPVELVRFDVVHMILSMLQNQEIMQSDSLVTNIGGNPLAVRNAGS